MVAPGKYIFSNNKFMENKKYPSWIDEYAKSFHHAFANMVPCSWGPLDGFSIFALLNGSFLSKIYNAIQHIKNQKKSLDEIAKSFSCPSTLRAAFYFLIWEYQNSEPKNKEQFKEIAEFFVGILQHMTKSDTFAYESNIVHSSEEVEKILGETKWSSAEAGVAREIGKLYNSLSSLVFALYRDYFPQDSHEIYGPYDASKKFGPGTILLIKYFPKIKPVEIWPDATAFKYKDVKILQVYREVKFECEAVGMHSIYEGDLINGLIAYAILVDGKYQNDPKDIKAFSDYFAEIATKQSLVYETMSKEELKRKFLEWESYQYFDFFKLANMDWQPSEAMINAVQDKDVPQRFELEQFPSFEEFSTNRDFEVYWLKDLYN